MLNVEKQRSQELDVVRCMMNYMIVVLHAWAAYQYVTYKGLEYVSWKFICSHVSWMAIPTFFLISGYLLFQKFSLATWPSKMVRRVRRLLVPYLCWNLLFVAFYLSVSHYVPRLGARVASFKLFTICGVLSKVLSLTEHPIDGPLWFIRALLFFALASPVLWLLIRWIRGIAVLLLCLVWCVCESVMGKELFLSEVAPAYALTCFVIGGVVAVQCKDIVSVFRNKVWLFVGVAACVIRAIVSMTNCAQWAMSDLATSIVLKLLSVAEAPALISLAGMLPVEKISINHLYCHLKEMSFFAYAGHFLFCSVWLHLVAPKLGGMGTGKLSLLIALFVVCGVSTMTVVYSLGKRLAPKVMKLFDGSL